MPFEHAGQHRANLRSNLGESRPADPKAVSTGRRTTRRSVLRSAVYIGLTSTTGIAGAQTATTNAGEEQWRFETTYPIPTAPTVVDGTVFIGCCSDSINGDGAVHALDADRGLERWRYERHWLESVNDSGPVAPVVGALEVVDGTVFVPGRGVFALDQETGEKQWRSEKRDYFIGNVLSSPKVYRGTVYRGKGSQVAAFNSAIGKLRWVEGPNPRGRTSPVVVDGTVYAAGGYRNLYAYDAETGDEEWQFEVEYPFITSPTVADGTLFVCNGGFMYAIDADSGQERMRYDPDWGILSSPTVADGTVYTGGKSYERDGGVVSAFDTGEGEERWRFEPRGVVRSSPTVAADTLFVGSDDGALYALDVADGSERWRFEAGASIRSAPIVVDGTVYVADTDGTVYALDAGVHGSSVDSRVLLGATGHHHAWANEASPDLAPDEFEVELDAAPTPVAPGDEITVQITVTNVGDIVGRRTLRYDAAASVGDENGWRKIHFDGQDSFEEPIELEGGESQTVEASGTVKRGPAPSTVPAPEWPGELSLAARVYEDEAELTIPIEKPANDQGDDYISDYWPVGALGGLGGAGYLLNRRYGGERK